MDFRLAERNRSRGLAVHVYSDGFRLIAARTLRRENVGRIAGGGYGAIAVALDLADAGDGSIHGIRGAPIKRGGPAASKIGRLGGELGRNGSDRNGSTGDAGVKTRLRRHVQSLFPLFGLGFPALVEIDGHLLAGFRGNRAGPDGVAFLRHGHLIGARLDKESLVPEPVPIEFVDVSHEIGGRVSVQENRGAGIAFEFDVSKRTGNDVSGWLKADAEVGRLAGGDVDALHFGEVAVVVDADLMIAGRKVESLAAIADGLAVNKHVGLLGIDMNLQLTCFRRRLRERRRHAEKEGGAEHEKDWTARFLLHLGNAPC